MVKRFKAEDLRDQHPHTTFLIDTDAGIKGLSNQNINYFHLKINPVKPWSLSVQAITIGIY